jgi:peptide/nickel transport system substrate-binding protein
MRIAQPVKALAVTLLSLAFVAGGCVRGGSDDDRAEKPAETAAASPTDVDDWTAGRIPDSVLEGEPKRGDQVVVRIASEPPSLNRHVDNDWWGSRITEHNIYEQLIRIDPYDDPDYDYIPVLAERFETNEDGTVFTFHLHRNVKWHDGKPFGAKDVIATFDMVRKSPRSVHMQSYMQELDKVEAVDDYTVRFTWKQPYSEAFIAMSTPIQPGHVLATLTPEQYGEAASNPLNRHPVGTGPWKFREWVSSQRIVLERNDDYWGRPPYLDRLVYRIVRDDTAALQLTERGEIDVLTSIPSENWVRMQSQTLKENYHRSLLHDATYSWIGWNQDRPIFKDARVRRALTKLVDRQGMIDHLFYGLPIPTTCHFYWASSACDPANTPLAYDPDAAMALLAEAGWKDTTGDGVLDDGEGNPFRFTFMIPSDRPPAQRMATRMREDFRRAGIDMQIQQVEWAGFTRRLRERQFDACSLAWGGSPRVGDPTQIWHSSSIEGGSNYIGYRNPEVDALIERARVEMDDDKRFEMYREFGRILHAEQPYTWLWVSPRLAVVHNRFRGVRETPLFFQFTDWWSEKGEAIPGATGGQVDAGAAEEASAEIEAAAATE